MNSYGERYFKWQKTVGEFGGEANLFKFKQYLNRKKDILDFGCGGGYLLKNINTEGRKIGIEINPSAREEAIANGIECYQDLSQLDDNCVDIIISNHALEHVEYPTEILRQFKRVLRNGGLVVVVVPHEMDRKKVSMTDHNMHLYTWTPQTLVNLFKICDINVVAWDSICHLWMPHHKNILELVGWNIWHKLCWLYCKIKGTVYQTRVVGVVKK